MSELDELRKVCEAANCKYPDMEVAASFKREVTPAVVIGLIDALRHALGVAAINDARAKGANETSAHLKAELAALKGGQGAVAWSLRREVDPCGLVRYMTQAKYEKQTEGVKAWYEPYKCASCDAPPAQASAWPEGLTAINRSMGRAIVRFKTTDQLNAFYRNMKAALAAAPTPGASDGKGGES